MKAIFLCEKSENVFRVYDSETVKALQEDTETDDRIYSKKDVLNTPEAFSDVEFIFSTWGMPSFTEDEIKSCFPLVSLVYTVLTEIPIISAISFTVFSLQ